SDGRPAWFALRSSGGAVWLALGAGASVLLAMLYWPLLRGFLQTTPLTAAQWIIPALAAALSLAVLEALRMGSTCASAPDAP
ncbi:MAG: cation transporting ATPase C-terminal domain-containing protein, partial [Elusimicrobia bacterium]|nr:cation transporting ATPase C-terminal domain-containing protein [Elusimicrobiota bacterium]